VFDACAVTTPDARCSSWTRDALLGPLLMLHAVGPLSVGLTYLVAQLTRTDVDVGIHAERGAALLRLRGSF
jgi:hypothetical protein